jgi:predicted AAA+ superfamily ATPase
MPIMYSRSLAPRVMEALSDRPVVIINGARQTGKTVLARDIIAPQHPAAFISLDDGATLSLAASDPVGFIAAQQGAVVIDEIQRVPELLLAIKHAVDRNRTPGRFLLTGSTNVLLVPKMADSLAGRMEIETLWPLTQGELSGTAEGFLPAVLSPEAPSLAASTEDRTQLARRMIRGGYPEAFALSETRRGDWFGSYLTSILQKDVRELADVEALSSFPRLLQAIAARTSSPANLSDLSRTLGIPWTTLQRYVALLKATFLVVDLPAWSVGEAKRGVRASKLYVSDSGLLAHQMRLDAAGLAKSPERFGQVLESFVVCELVRQAASRPERHTLSHYGKHQTAEVDIVVEGPGGAVAGIEVKSAVTLGPHDFQGLRYLANAAGERFVRGIVLYGGTETIRASAPPVELLAMPIDALWRLGA